MCAKLIHQESFFPNSGQNKHNLGKLGNSGNFLAKLRNLDWALNLYMVLLHGIPLTQEKANKTHYSIILYLLKDTIKNQY